MENTVILVTNMGTGDILDTQLPAENVITI
jgi:hypothetical protein